MRTRWRRLLDVDDADHLCGVAELFNLYGAHINPSPSKVGPLCERTTNCRHLADISALTALALALARRFTRRVMTGSACCAPSLATTRREQPIRMSGSLLRCRD